MDETKILSGKQIVQKGALKLNTALPEVGVKDAEPNGSWLEKKQIQVALDTRKHFIGVERIEKCGVLSHAEWREDLKLAEVTQKVGGYWQFLGHNAGKKLFLNPEEALFLMEVNCLLLKYSGVKVSLEQAYSLLLPNDKERMQYKVYAALSRLGYRVYRHQIPQPTETVILTDVDMEEQGITNDEEKIKTSTANDLIETVENDTEIAETQADVPVDKDSQEPAKATKQREQINESSSLTQNLPKSHSKISRIAKYVENRINRLNSSRYKPKSKRAYAILNQFLGLPDFTKHPEATVNPPPIDFVPSTIGFSRSSYTVNVDKIHRSTIRVLPTDDSRNTTNVPSHNVGNSNVNKDFNPYSFPHGPVRTKAIFDLWTMQVQQYNTYFDEVFRKLFPVAYAYHSTKASNEQRVFRPSDILTAQPPYQPHFQQIYPLVHQLAHLAPDLVKNRPPLLPPFHPPNHPANQSIYQPANQSTNQATYQPPNQQNQPTSQSSNIETTDTEANTGDRARKRTREKSKNQLLDQIQQMATEIRNDIMFKSKMPAFDILELKGLIDKFNSEYAARVRLSNNYTVSYTENIVDLVELDDDGEVPDKRLKDDGKMQRLEQLAQRLRDLRAKNEVTTKHRKAFEKLIQRFNKTYNANYYLNADFHVRDLTLPLSDTDNDISVPSTSKKLKNPFSILKQISDKQNDNNNKTQKINNGITAVCASEIVYAYSRAIEDTFNGNWLPPESYFGRPEIITKNEAKYSLDITKEELMLDFVKIQPKKFSNWFEVKMAFYQCLLKTAELLLSEKDQIKENEIKNRTLSSLLNPEDFCNSAVMLEKLSIIKSHKEFSPSTALIVDFDVYNRDVQNFRKSIRPAPHFRVLCIRESSSLPSGADIYNLHSKYKDNIPILFAIVGSGSISYLQVNPADIPVYLSANN